MEATVLSVGKSVLNGALGYAKSTLAEEVALQLGVWRDQLFITNELEMMQAFLMAAHDERDDSQVVKVWVKQVRNVAYDVEDSLQEFAVRLGRQSWWRIHRTLQDRRLVAKKMKELRANVEDVSQRNMRYNLIKGSGSKRPTAVVQSAMASATMSGVDDARWQMDKAKVDLIRLISNKDDNFRVIALSGTNTCHPRETSVIRRVYEDREIEKKFKCRAWISLIRPCNLTEFLRSILEQFHVNFLQDQAGEIEQLTLEVQVLRKMGIMAKEDDLAREFTRYLNEKKYLIVLNDIHTIEEWDQIKICFPKNKKGSRIIVSAEQVGVASLCVGPVEAAPEYKKLLVDKTLYAFYEKGSQDGTNLTKTGSSSNRSTISIDMNSSVFTTEILEDQPNSIDGKRVIKKSLSRIRTMAAALEESHIVGRVKEKYDIIKLITNQATQPFKVISVWGMGGLGKTTLIRDVYQTQEVSGTFEKRACVTIMRPFNLEELLRSLIMQLDRESSEKEEMVGTIKMTLPEKLTKLIEKKRCLIVLDDISSTAEWNMVKNSFHEMENTSRIIVTTREENIAKHCSEKQENMYKLKCLDYKDACDLFTKKVFGSTANLDEQHPELVAQANQILRKCSGLPLAVVTIGGFLANQPKTTLEWRKLNEHISAELEMNPELGIIRTVLTKSYDGLPYDLKSCFLYMPIFPEDFKIGRRRLVRRWTAEGYPREVRGKSAEEISDSYFMELISRSMILPSQQSIHSIKGIDSCQVHDHMREIGISKSAEENLVFRLDEDCSSNTMDTTRHITINNNWKGDQAEFESIVDMSRVRSITIFGEWKSFFISDKMNMLRVLDLENTTGLHDSHVKHIGKLLHLRYLSLRGCDNIFHLPDSIGNLRQVETLDVRGTRIVKLPKSIVKLEKLTYLCAGRKYMSEDLSHEELVNRLPEIMRNKLCVPFSSLALVCLACRQLHDEDILNQGDKCTAICCFVLPFVVMHLDRHGVVVPRGMRKLKALRALGVVNISQGKDVVKDIKRFTQLRKLGVTGINKKNGQEFCAAIADHNRLESLSIRSEGEPGLRGCLDGMSSPPENLLSLKLYGNLVLLPAWINELKNVVKLKLRSTELSDIGTTMEVLGKLSHLASLHLLRGSFMQDKEGFCLNFQKDAFPSLLVLEIYQIKPINFEAAAAPKLELIKFVNQYIDSDTISGLPSLSGLKEVLIHGGYHLKELEWLQAELANNPNKPVYKHI